LLRQHSRASFDGKLLREPQSLFTHLLNAAFKLLGEFKVHIETDVLQMFTLDL